MSVTILCTGPPLPPRISRPFNGPVKLAVYSYLIMYSVIFQLMTPDDCLMIEIKLVKMK